MLKIGYKASAEQFGPRDLVEYAVLAEEVGLDSVWISDHFQPWRHEGGHAPQALPWLAAVGERTERVLLGTSVLTPTFRYNPAVLAQVFATLGSLYPGRIALGVGSGEALNEIAVGSVPNEGEWPDFKERSGRLRESIQLMRRLWSEDRVTFEGTYYHTKDATIYDKPGEPIPVYMAAGGPQMAKSVGRNADGFICTSGKGEELYASLLGALGEAAEAAGRDVSGIDKMIEIKLSYAPTREEALENTRFWAALALTPEQKHSVHDPSEMQALADALPIEQVAKRWIVATTPEEVVVGLKPYVEQGFNHLVFHPPGDDQGGFLKSFADEVVPALRELG
ncbi:glucose-6-phosphate dehydrogenase (coenzyme-F420) [Nocardioides sp. Iso805N]|uniref:glucose-6-phosphate dehydrogenase (coenzyme-F420) n=1 Tax=Nocardioides sp. Iso805N TaxID=1283287 RepID=UPI0005662CF6|nr:glucose-6-phosphate dehydrogenase (coenzyme-F420) [Nocardioides sp. Iso805N]